ncbi:MAG: ComF family protein [Phormidesmis sp.]
MSIVASAKYLSTVGIKSLLGVVLKTGCSVCDRPTNTVFCVDCQRQIEADCYSKTQWQLDTSGEIPVGALGPYRGTLKQAIRALKYEHRSEVASVLGAALGQRWRSRPQHQPHQPRRQHPNNRVASSGLQVTECAVSAVPIPLHANRLSQRGYNQAALIARSFCHSSGLPLIEHGLVRVQDTQPQHQLGLGERQENLKSAFSIGTALQKRQQRSSCRLSVLLIDDIYTTGATTQSAAEVLIAAGISVVGMLSVARAVKD